MSTHLVRLGSSVMTAVLFGSLSAFGEDLTIDGTTQTLSANATYSNIYIKNGGSLRVDSGALVKATTIYLGDNDAATTDPGVGSIIVEGATLQATLWVSRNAPNDGTKNTLMNVLTLGPGARFIGGGRIVADPGLRLEFAGGVWQPTYAVYNAHALAAIAQNSNVEVRSVDGCDIKVDGTNQKEGTALNLLYMQNASHLVVSGSGDFVITDTHSPAITSMRLPGDRTNVAGTIHFHDFTSFTGKVRILGAGVGLLHRDALGAGRDWEFSAGVLDLNGVNQAFGSVRGSGLVTNQVAVASTVALASKGDEGDVAFVGDNISVVCSSEGETRWAAALPSKLTVSSGSLVPVARPGVWRFYRFKVDGVKNSAGDRVAPQMDEFVFLDGTTNVNTLIRKVTWGTTTIAGVNPQTPAYLFDGICDETHKWCDLAFGSGGTQEQRDACWWQVDFGAPRHITAYTWYTGNNIESADPTAWKLYGSQDGEDWTLIDARTDYQATSARDAVVDTFVPSNRDVVRDLGEATMLTVADDASLVSNDRTIRLANEGGTIKNLALSGPASLVKVGSGVTTVVGGNAAQEGTVCVSAGTLAYRGPEHAKYYRVCFKLTGSGGTEDANSYPQLEEFALYAADGTRVGMNLAYQDTQGDISKLNAGCVTAGDINLGNGDGCKTTTDPLGYGTYAANAKNLFDGVMTGDSKWCIGGTALKRYLKQDGLNDSSKWDVMVFRLPSDAKPVVSYLMATGNDSIKRSPTHWSVEVSDDGQNWTLVDEKSGAAYPNAFNAWYNDGNPWPLANFSSGDTAFSEATIVEVGEGAVLDVANTPTKIGGLRVSMNGAGTIKGFDAATVGVLYVDDYERGAKNLTLPISFESAESTDFSGWTVVINGRSGSYKVAYRDDELELIPPGLMLLFR